MTRTILAAAAIFGLVLSPAFAQETPKVKGTVEKVDESAEKITLDHAPIPNLDMGEMKMVFKAGDKVQFTADRVNGQISVTSIKQGS